MTVKWDSAAAIAAVRRKAVQGVTAATALVEDTSVQKITSGPKTGRIYRRNGVNHQASAPGEAPATDSNTLLPSRRTEVEENGLVGKVSYNTPYARRLELGDEVLAPRPYLIPALEENRVEVRRLIASFIGGSRR